MTIQSDGVPLLNYASMVWRRRVLVLIITLVMAVPAFAVSALQTPRYQATAQILLSQQQLDEDFNIETAVLTDTQVDSLIAILTSVQVAERARQQGGTSEVQAVSSTDSNVVTVTAEDFDPRRAAATIGAYVQAFSGYLTRQERQTLDDAAAQLESTIARLQERISSAAPEDRFRLQDQLTIPQGQLGRIQVQQELIASGVTMVQNPTVPQSPVSPTPVRNALLALVLGLALGISLAVLLETLQRRSDVESPAYAPVPEPPPERQPLAGTAVGDNTRLSATQATDLARSLSQTLRRR